MFQDPDTAAPSGTQYGRFHSATIAGPASYLVYLPPDYQESAARYPVVYWLHGLNGTQRDGTFSFVPYLDAAIRAGNTPPAIAVLVNGLGDSRYYDSFDGQRPVESVIIGDLIPHIDSAYRTLGTRQGRAIEGFSMGGFGAAHLGFKYPELFGSVSIMAGALLDDESAAGAPDLIATPGLFEKCFGTLERFHAGNPWVVVRENADRIRGRVTIRMAVGDNDALYPRNRRYHELLDELGIAHTFTVLAGVGHDHEAIYERLSKSAACASR